MGVGSKVQVVGRAVLARALTGDERPEPGQFAFAGRRSRIVHVRRAPDGTLRYGLEGAPGLWRAEWLTAER